LILRSEKIVFIIKGLILLIGFPNNKYPPNTKDYLRCLLFGGGLVLGGRDYIIATCIHFPECRARVRIFTLGVWGLRVCSLDVAPPFATVRNRPQPFANRAWGECYKSVHFWRFETLCNLASCGRHGTLWHRNMFHNVSKVIATCFVICQKSFCVTGAILLRGFQKMTCIFRSRGSTLETSIVILRGRRSTLDVWCCVFFAIRIVRAASTGDNVQIAWQAWHLVTCDENWWRPARNIDFEIANFEVIRKTRRKTSILEYQSWNISTPEPPLHVA